MGMNAMLLLQNFNLLLTSLGMNCVAGRLARVRVGKLDSSRASLSRKIFRKHARTNVFGSLPSTTRALLHIFHRDGPDSSHGSWLGFLAARASVGLFGMVNTINCIAG